MRHLFSKAAIDGTPEIDLRSGVVSGLRVSTDTYKALGGDSDCCDRVVGGRIYLEQDGKRFELVGDSIRISPANVERTSDATASGRLMTTITPKLSFAEIEMARFCDGDPLEFFNAGCKTNVTIVEQDF